MVEISLTTNWNTLGDADLLSVLIKSKSDDTENLDDLTADNCVCLVHKDDREKSKAEIEVKCHGCIKSITLLSEALIIEVFGVNDEYLFTHNAEFFDDWEEMAVYYSKICIPNIPVCKLKFTRTRNEDRVWIYGAKIHVQSKAQHQQDSPKNFNLEQISRLLGNSNFANINSNNNFKNLLQFYFKNLPNNNLGYLLGKKPVTNDIHTTSSSSRHGGISQDSGVTEILSRLQVNAPDSVEPQKTCSSESYSNNSWFTSYIDKKFREMKTEILNDVDAKINNLREETNCKLDKIISLLESQWDKTQSMK